MFEKDAVSAADGSLPVAFGIEGEADARSGVEKMPLHTAHVGSAGDRGVGKSRRGDRTSWSATLHHAIKRISRTGYKGSRLSGDAAVRIHLGSIRQLPRGGVEIVGLVVALAVGTKETESYSQIQSQLSCRVEVILEIRLQDFIAVVILGLRA